MVDIEVLRQLAQREIDIGRLQTRVKKAEDEQHESQLHLERACRKAEALQARVTELENLTTGMATRTDAMIQTAYTERDAALARATELEKQEPVAYRYKYKNAFDREVCSYDLPFGTEIIATIPLYASPVPAKTLTDAEITKLYLQHIKYQEELPEASGVYSFAHAIEQALKGGA